MSIRKTTTAQIIDDYMVEMKAREESLERLVHKFETTGYLTKDERELADDHVRWINSHKKEIKDFFRPAMCMA